MKTLLASAASLLLAGCTIIDIRTDDNAPGVESDAFISGYATFGWPSNDHVARLEILGGRSKGALLSLEIWKLMQVELGLLGVSAGVGPLNAGIGILFYEPESPIYGTDWWSLAGAEGDAGEDDDDEDEVEDEDEGDDGDGIEDEDD